MTTMRYLAGEAAEQHGCRNACGRAANAAVTVRSSRNAARGAKVSQRPSQSAPNSSGAWEAHRVSRDMRTACCSGARHAKREEVSSEKVSANQ